MSDWRAQINAHGRAAAEVGKVEVPSQVARASVPPVPDPVPPYFTRFLSDEPTRRIRQQPKDQHCTDEVAAAVLQLLLLRCCSYCCCKCS